MTLSTITINTIDYIAYASLAEANTYLAVDPVRMTKWATLTDPQKNTYLVAATRRLDLSAWTGSKTGGAAQENQWPRTGVTYTDGTAVPTDEVPIEIQNACCLLAGSIANDSTAAESGTSGNNKKRVKAGSAEIEYFKPTTGSQLQDETAFRLVKDFFAGAVATSVASGAYASGTDCASSFESDQDGFGLSEGYP
jgi:hypothetical protein